MKSRIQKYFIISIVALLLFSYTNINVKSNESYTTTDIDNLAFKQELTIPIDTSLDESKFQPIDIRIDFNSPCWAKDEKHH